jgi:hypothetical protein
MEKPRLITDARYALVSDRYYSGSTGYDDLLIARDEAVARLAFAIADLRPAGHISRASSKALITRRSRELLKVVGQSEYRSAEAEARRLGEDYRAYRDWRLQRYYEGHDL